jgi:mRNA-degrading endonuclease YafQ of YafQ-DinJ toxin-antitoxin module
MSIELDHSSHNVQYLEHPFPGEFDDAFVICHINYDFALF